MRSLIILPLFAMATVASAFDFITRTHIKWDAGEIPINLQLDETMSPFPLIDGKNSWNAVAREALEHWNAQLSQVQFTTYTDLGRGDGNEENEVFFSPQLYGRALGRGVLAVTTVWRVGTERVEGDTVFNSEINWDSFRGDMTGSLVDLRRVAMHEFGHTLGLDHPDQAGQVKVAVMNSHISDLDGLSEDDMRGARALYPTPDQLFSLNVELDSPEAGAVTVNPAAPGGLYPWGSVVTLTAKPSRRFRFNFWDGSDSQSTRKLKVRMYEDQHIVARFMTNVAPRITAHPRSQLAVGGETISFRVRAVAGPAAEYQWQHNGEDLPGETQSTLTLFGVIHEDSGEYTAIVTNSKGQVRSKPALLVVDGY